MFEIFIALGAGLVSFLSPCVLPLIPGYISYISGSQRHPSRSNTRTFGILLLATSSVFIFCNDI